MELDSQRLYTPNVYLDVSSLYHGVVDATLETSYGSTFYNTQFGSPYANVWLSNDVDSLTITIPNYVSSASEPMVELTLGTTIGSNYQAEFTAEFEFNEGFGWRHDSYDFPYTTGVDLVSTVHDYVSAVLPSEYTLVRNLRFTLSASDAVFRVVNIGYSDLDSQITAIESVAYDLGYLDGYDIGYGEGEENGFIDGLASGEEIGYDKGYDKGYEQGKYDGYGDKPIKWLLDILDSIFDFKLIRFTESSALTVGSIITVSLCVPILLWFLKLFAGG